MKLSARTLMSTAAVVLGLLTACDQAPEPATTELAASDAAATATNPPTSADVHASYVLLAASADGSPAAYARVIMDDGFDCPTVAATCGTGTPESMTARDKPIFDTAKHCPAGGCFPVTVCEAAVPFNETRQICLSGGQINLPEPTTDPTNILVVGDTGCKSKKGDDGGVCEVSDGATAQPFQNLVTNAGTGFDLVLHMGDYNYRGTPGSAPFEGPNGPTTHYPYDAGDGAPNCQQSAETPFLSQASANSLLPDQWTIWQKDFFEPAIALLADAPWVFARGNHELCSRAGAGWFYFLDAGFKPAGTQVDCPALPNGDPPVNPFLFTRILPMYQVDLGSLNLVVLDSANACDQAVPAPGNSFRTEYENQFQNLKVPETGTNWIVSHRPFWINATLQATSSGSSTGSYLQGIPLSLAGHEHLFASYTPTTPSFPGEVVTGNGGVKLEGDFDGLSEQTVAGEKIWVQGAKGHGFLHVQFDGTSGSWCGDLRDASNNLTASCASSNSPSLCTAPTKPCEASGTAASGSP